MTISLHKSDESMETRHLEKSCQNREFSETRINEVHSFLTENDFDNSAFRQKVKFVCISSCETISENDRNPAKLTESNKNVGIRNRKGRNSISCDIFLLAAASKACGTTWLTRELESHFLSESSVGEDIIILLQDEEAFDDLEYLLQSLTVWSPKNPCRLMQILESRVGQILGLDPLLEENYETHINGKNQNKTLRL